MELYAWREKLAPYELAVEELVIKFRRMMSDYRAAGRYSLKRMLDNRPEIHCQCADLNLRLDPPVAVYGLHVVQHIDMVTAVAALFGVRNIIVFGSTILPAFVLSASLKRTSIRWWKSSGR